jgi:hypothetical protein
MPFLTPPKPVYDQLYHNQVVFNQSTSQGVPWEINMREWFPSTILTLSIHCLLQHAGSQRVQMYSKVTPTLGGQWIDIKKCRYRDRDTISLADGMHSHFVHWLGCCDYDIGSHWFIFISKKTLFISKETLWLVNWKIPTCCFYNWSTGPGGVRNGIW